MPSRSRRAWIAIIGLILVLTACSPGAPAPPPTQAAQPPSAGSVPSAQEGATPGSAVNAAEPSAPTLVPVKTTLEATDPATVDLASGGPLLVEFFAFW